MQPLLGRVRAQTIGERNFQEGPELIHIPKEIGLRYREFLHQGAHFVLENSRIEVSQVDLADAPNCIEPSAKQVTEKAELGVLELESEAARDDATEALDVTKTELDAHRDAPSNSRAAQTDSGTTRALRNTSRSSASSAPIAEIISAPASRSKGGSSWRELAGIARTPKTASKASTTRRFSALIVTKRVGLHPLTPSSAPVSMTGSGTPRMMESPLTNSGAPTNGSTGSGRIVSTMCSSGSPQSHASTWHSKYS